MHNVRTRYIKPSHVDKGHSLPVAALLVAIRHPFYDDSNNALLYLPALDIGGTVHHDTALAACCVLSNNSKDGYLAEDRLGIQRVDRAVETLEGNNYYFHIPGMLEYGIVRKFEDWKFPHQDMPFAWRRLRIPNLDRELPRSTATAVLSRDLSCRISLNQEGTQSAHLLPVAHATWFDLNGMSSYTFEGSDVGRVTNQSNALLLRADLHLSFDAHRFVFAPKWDPLENQHVLVTHSFDRNPKSEIVCLYHNVPLQPLSGIAVEFAYARFALAVFSLLDKSSFLNRGVRRLLHIRNIERYTTKWYTAEQCREMVRQFRPRSMSPKTRKPDAPESKGDDFEDDDHEDCRGRKRRRTASIEAEYPTPNT